MCRRSQPIINEATQAYRGVLPADRWHEPYMPADELAKEIAAGVVFWAPRLRRAQPARSGVGTKLLRHVEGLTDKPILIGTWANASWAIDFYQRNGFTVVPQSEKDRLLRTYWSIRARQVETSVVLADGRWTKALGSSMNG
jgi:hypothetical protein